MPSASFLAFDNNLLDVNRLIDTHVQLSGGSPGKKGLGHLTRSGVVMLCACWERYVEQLVIEVSTKLTGALQLPTQLPPPVQLELAESVRNAKHQLQPLFMAGDGWKNVYMDLAESQTDTLNTPKTNKVDGLFQKLVGVPQLSSGWSISSTIIDSFVGVRGDIAHQGRQAAYVSIAQLIEYRDQIRATSVDTDNSVAVFLKTVLPSQHLPWKRTQ